VSRISRFAILVVALAVARADRAAGDEFADFRIPDHKVFSLTGDVAATASSNENAFLGDGKSGVVAGTLSTSAFWMRDSDPLLRRWSVNVLANGDRAGSEARDAFATSETRRRRVQEQWALSFGERRYPFRRPLGIEFTASVLGRYDQDWQRERLVEDVPPVVTTRKNRRNSASYEYVAAGSAAIGVGRVRDATAVYDVAILEDRLRRRNVLAGPLTPETRNRIAGLVYTRGSFPTVLDRPGKSFWAALFEILRADPSYSGRFDPSAVLETLEPYIGGTTSEPTDLLPRSPVGRLRGVFAGVVAQARYSSRTRRAEFSDFVQQTVSGVPQPPVTFEASNRTVGDDAEILVGPQVEWRRPIGLRWQADFTSVLFFTTEAHSQDGVRFISTGSVRWIVADRWLAGADLGYLRSTVGDGNVWVVNGTAYLDWYIENRLRLRLQAAEQQHREEFFFSSFRRFHGISLSLGYRFAGRLEAPGLMEAVSAR
jgi:hypothetical protein